MTSEEEERPSFVTGGYERHRRQWVNIERFRNNDSAINFYTGFSNWNTFMAVFKFLDPGDSGENIRY